MGHELVLADAREHTCEGRLLGSGLLARQPHRLEIVHENHHRHRRTSHGEPLVDQPAPAGNTDDRVAAQPAAVYARVERRRKHALERVHAVGEHQIERIATFRPHCLMRRGKPRRIERKAVKRDHLQHRRGARFGGVLQQRVDAAGRERVGHPVRVHRMYVTNARRSFTFFCPVKTPASCAPPSNPLAHPS